MRRATCPSGSYSHKHGISIHALLAESDLATIARALHISKFLSTLSLRRATRQGNIYICNPVDFYPRSPCGERLVRLAKLCEVALFLSTLSLRRATWGLPENSPGIADFYPRSPCGERPTITGIIYSDRKISIHALLAESDRATSFAVSVAENFYPRSPCGERPEADGIVDVIGEFLSTLSLRRATPAVRTSGYCSLYFYPRSPCGERQQRFCQQKHRKRISIHALLAESDRSWPLPCG